MAQDPDATRAKVRKRRAAPPKKKSIGESVDTFVKKVQSTDVVKKAPPPAKPSGVPAAEIKDTKGDADRARSERGQRSATQRKAVRDTYAEQSPQRRREIADAAKGNAGPAAEEVRRFHGERVRVEGYKRAADRFEGR